MATGFNYCQLSDVTGRLYAGQGLNPGDPAPDDPTRDALLKSLIATTSRDFDQEVWEGTEAMNGIFTPIYEARLFSGLGDQILPVMPFSFMAKVEIDATPGQLSHTWNDYTAEFGQNKMGAKPIRGYPKKELFRQSSFYMDPFRLGNVRLTAVWGIVLPDPALAQPAAPWFGLTTAAQIQALAPDPTQTTGWWATPDDVIGAVASWTVHRYQMSKTGYGEDSNTGVAEYKVNKAIPGDVQRVIQRYRGEQKQPKFALVANDGSDVETFPTYRWAGWQTIR